jgi:hypothetical protein
MTSKQEYTQLIPASDQDEDPMLDQELWEEKKISKSSPRRYFRPSLALPFLIGVVIGIIVGCASMVAFNKILPSLKGVGPLKAPDLLDVNKNLGFTINPQTGESRCGNNWQEAKQLGCHYDLMASRWYSDDCYNDEVLQTMLKEVNFQWYADREHTEPVTTDFALTGQFDALWPLHDFHIMHCLYLWRRLHSAIVQHRHLDDDVYAYGHTVHCTRLIMQWPNEWKYGKNSTTIATSGRPFCRKTPL